MLGPLGAEILAPFVFVLALCTAHRCSPSRSLFLDIACIRQDSDAAKADGIAALGAVLDRSERMLVLCDAHYFTRLWCTFELAAYTKRAGAARIDLLPLHEPLVVLSFMLDMACFLLVGSVVGGVLGTAAPELLESESYTMLMPLLMLLTDAPAQFFIIFAQVQAYEGSQAVSQLSRFTLTDAQCHSAEDREELQTLIAQWFTERSGNGGGGDPEDHARRVGFHRFEQFVRHNVAPTLTSGRSHYLKLMLCTSIFSCAPMFDILCSDAFTANHAPGVICIMVIGFVLIVPLKLFVFWHSAGVVLTLRNRCGWPAACAYGVGVVLNFFGALSMVLMFFLAGPTTMLDPAYRLPDDSLDPVGRKMLATQIGGMATAIGICAVTWVFKL